MSSRKLNVRIENWGEEPFAIARGSTDNFDVVVVELEQDDCRGRGEATPTKHYHESISQTEILSLSAGKGCSIISTPSF